VDTLYNQVGAAATTGPNPRGCNNVEPWMTNVRGLASYTIPTIGVLVSTVIRSQTAAEITANWIVPNSVIQAANGGILPPGATATGTTTILLTDNEHRVYADTRRTQVDMRFAKIVRFGRARADIGVDLNNLFNTDYATAYNTNYTYTTDNAPRQNGWATPTNLVSPRFMRFNITFNF
jgi:hypothetical protein